MTEEEEEIRLTYEFVAASSTASEMARAGLRRRLWQPRTRRALVIIWACLTLLWSATYNGGLSWASRLVGLGVVAGVLVVLVTAVMVPIAFVVNRRNLSQTCRAGAVMRTGFGSDA